MKWLGHTALTPSSLLRITHLLSRRLSVYSPTDSIEVSIDEEKRFTDVEPTKIQSEYVHNFCDSREKATQMKNMGKEYEQQFTEEELIREIQM